MRLQLLRLKYPHSLPRLCSGLFPAILVTNHPCFHRVALWRWEHAPLLDWGAYIGFLCCLQQGQPPPNAVGGAYPYMPAAPAGPPPDATRIVSLLEAVTVEELSDPKEYDEILEDMRDECGKHGQVRVVHLGSPHTLDMDSSLPVHLRT